MGHRRVFACVVLATGLLTACSSHASTAPHAVSTSPYWIADKSPTGYRIEGAALVSGDPEFTYASSAKSDLASGTRAYVSTQVASRCASTRGALGVQTTHFNGHAAWESPDSEEDTPFGWVVHWMITKSRCVSVLVDMGGPDDVPAAKRFAHQIAATVRPTTYEYFHAMCTKPITIAGHKVTPHPPGACGQAAT